MTEPEPDFEPTFVDATVTCQTEDCPNAGAAIVLSVPGDPWPPYVVCGVCGEQINDVTTN